MTFQFKTPGKKFFAGFISTMTLTLLLTVSISFDAVAAETNNNEEVRNLNHDNQCHAQDVCNFEAPVKDDQKIAGKYPESNLQGAYEEDPFQEKINRDAVADGFKEECKKDGHNAHQTYQGSEVHVYYRDDSDQIPFDKKKVDMTVASATVEENTTDQVDQKTKSVKVPVVNTSSMTANDREIAIISEDCAGIYFTSDNSSGYAVEEVTVEVNGEMQRQSAIDGTAVVIVSSNGYASGSSANPNDYASEEVTLKRAVEGTVDVASGSSANPNDYANGEVNVAFEDLVVDRSENIETHVRVIYDFTADNDKKMTGSNPLVRVDMISMTSLVPSIAMSS